MVLKFLEKSCAYVFDKNDFNFDYEIPPAFDSEDLLMYAMKMTLTMPLSCKNMRSTEK